MANKEPADRTAHERLPADRSEKSADATDKTTGTPDREHKNPLSKLRFGSAGSGGAEREPGPERP